MITRKSACYTVSHMVSWGRTVLLCQACDYYLTFQLTKDKPSSMTLWQGHMQPSLTVLCLSLQIQARQLQTFHSISMVKRFQS